MGTPAEKKPIRYDMVDPASVPRRLSPRGLMWHGLLKRCIETGERAMIHELDGKRPKPRSVRSAIHAFCKRFPELVAGFKIRTQRHEDGTVYVSAERLDGARAPRRRR